PGPTAAAAKERTEFEVPPRPASPKVNRSPQEAAIPAEDTARKTKRPAPARPTMLPPQVSGSRSSPPAQSPPPGSGSPGTPRALPRRLVGSNLRAPTVPPPLPPQPARRQSRPSQASPGPASPSPVFLSAAEGALGEASEEGGGPEAVGGRDPAAPHPQPRHLASETN
ncbi:PREDICTED: SH3 domain-binding protein 1-like, partial [Condylura cristata]|uniref:SH3 domain-binding protein 1-like n=1 Tax=Condylura cristata TaxID=143302 RepID=UPI000642A73A